ncbi:hypothetical protein [Serratia fonticola]|uniref:hypothetical protein n=1 Tax=Serratia fonticola TaxID=47917 RepID=UPI00093A16E9|nr:hypothetical protein [Serratia fonticola]OKP23814.1 hypothetical protein BSQ40_24260 [Serratia fonticola]
MNRQQQAMIFSPCLFTRTGVAELLGDIPGLNDPVCLATLTETAGVLTTLAPGDVLLIHVTALLAAPEWAHLDTKLSLHARRCHVVILCDADCASVLAVMPCLVARAAAVLDSGASRDELVTCLRRVMQ